TKYTTPVVDTAWEAVNEIEIGGRNLLTDSDLSKSITGTAFTVGGVTYNTYASGYAYYNGGITNPTTSYHAYLDTETFPFPVIVYNESNGVRNWKGASKDISSIIKETGIGTYTISFDVYATGAGTKLFGGFYYVNKGETSSGFHSGQYEIRPTKVDEWHRVSATFNLNSDVDFDKTISFYFYGYGFTTNSILYVRN